MMKRFLTAMMALVMIVTLSQCKKQNEENEDNTAKVRISCTIPLNNDDKTDFTNILNGEVNWSAEPERIYLAIPYDNNDIEHQIVALTSVTHEGTPSTLTFEGQVEKGLLKPGIHDIWYMGRSQDSKLDGGKVTGSIAEQSGSKDDLGYHHIAKALVDINVDNGITMTFEENFKNQMAIAHLDLTNVAGLSGEAIVGTDYSLEYIDGVYRLKVTGNNSINITGSENKNESYVVLFPTDRNAKDVELNSDSNKKITFRNGIKQNALYKENDNKPLIWELPEHECVDLGLPSKVKWATCNIGAGSPEAYGKYYAWGEIEEPLPLPAGGYLPATCGTYNKQMSDISGHETYDAATANWGKDWRIPTKAQCEELMNEEYCTWEWIDNGYLVTSKINGNYIFLPAAGFKSGRTDVINDGGVYGTYSCSTPAERGNDDDAEKSYNLSFNDKTKAIARIYRENGRPVRPVTGGDFKNPAAQYAEVTTAEVSGITLSTAVCGGVVTSDEYSDVTERGICWRSTNDNPTMDNGNIVVSASAGTGEYTVELIGLPMNTTCYVRAYAITGAGISYGAVKSFTTANIGVITSDVTDVTISTAVCGGEVIANSEVKERGVCYSTSENPTIENGNKVLSATPASGEYTVELTELIPNTTYYVKAYAVINSKVYYGELKSFKTSLENVNGHECVDLGLSVKWATCNVGATSPEEYGNYYAWGETEPAPNNNYTEDNCSTYGLDESDLQSEGYVYLNVHEEYQFVPQYDAATVNWGATWRMPTYIELNELHTECEWTWTTQNGVKGCKVVGPNGNSIFLPAAGGYVGSSLEEVEKYVLLWSSKPSNNTEYAYYLYYIDDINIDECDMMEYFRYYGFSVRPVLK